MAKAPSKTEVQKTLEQSRRAVVAKREAQKKQGKDFVELGQGVMPETVWKSLPGKKAEQDG